MHCHNNDPESANVGQRIGTAEPESGEGQRCRTKEKSCQLIQWMQSGGGGLGSGITDIGVVLVEMVAKKSGEEM